MRLGETLPALSFVSAYQESVVVGTFWNALHSRRGGIGSAGPVLLPALYER